MRTPLSPQGLFDDPGTLNTKHFVNECSKIAIAQNKKSTILSASERSSRGSMYSYDLQLQASLAWKPPLTFTQENTRTCGGRCLFIISGTWGSRMNLMENFESMDENLEVLI